MKILWVSHFLLYPRTGFGALQRSRNLLEAISRSVEVELICLVTQQQWEDQRTINLAKESLSPFCASIQFVRRSGGSGDVQKLLCATRSFLMGRPYSVGLYDSSELRNHVLKRLSTGEIALVHADTLGLVEPILFQLTSDYKVPVVLNHHNVESSMMRRRAHRQPFGWTRWFMTREAELLGRYERHWCAHFAGNLVVSAADGSDLVGQTGLELDKVFVIDNPVDINYFTPGEVPLLEHELVFIGGMDWYPNKDAIEYFIGSVWPVLRNRFPQLKLTVVGKDIGVDATLRNVPGVCFTGFVDDVRSYLTRALAFVCPMRDGGGTRLKVVDALAAGIPLISTKMGCEGLELVEGVEVLFAESPEQWCQQIEKLLASPELREQLRRAGREKVQRLYSASAVAEKLVQ